MKIVLAGAERGASRRLLLANSVERLGVNLSQLSVPKTKSFDLNEVFGGAEVWLYTSDDDEDVDRFDAFIREHHDSLHTIIGRPDYDGSWMGSKYVPLWNDGHDLERLAHLCEKNPRVAVSDRALTKTSIDRIRQLAGRWNTQFTALTSKLDWLEAYEWDNVVVVHWTSVMKYGETQVWDGHNLRRYSAKQKESSRRKHRADIARLNVDFDAIMEDDSQAVTTLAIRSWLEWEMSTDPAYRPVRGVPDEEEFSLHDVGIATNTAEMHDGVSGDLIPSNPATPPAEKRHESEKRLLPHLALDIRSPQDALGGAGGTNSDSPPSQRSVGIARSGQTLRQCSSCYLASRCPEFRPGVECAYEFPVKLESMEQLKRMCNVILEMQVERAMFGSFAEQLEGQGADPTVSKELDRIFTYIEAISNLNDDRDVFSLQVKARSGASVIESIFGAEAKNRMNQLPVPIDTDSVLEEVGFTPPPIHDAEVVE